MKTFAGWALGVVLAVGLVGRADDKKADKADAPKIAGSYTLVKGTKNGEATDDNAKKAKYTIDAKKIVIDGGDAKFVISYKIDAAAKPMTIDMVMDEAPFEGVKGSKGYGVIELKGDTLKLAYSTDKDKRPKDFTGKEGFAFELKRAKPKE